MQEREFLVVAGDAVGSECAATGASVYECPLAVVADVDADGLHGGSAAAGAVAWLVVDVSGPQAVGAVVSVACAEGCAV